MLQNYGKTLNIVEEFTNEILPKSSYLQTPTIIEDSNEITNGHEMGDLKPTAVDEIITIVWNVPTLYWKPTTPLVPMSWKKRKSDFTNGLTNIMCGIVTPTHLRKELKLGASTHLLVILMFSTLPKPIITESQKQEL